MITKRRQQRARLKRRKRLTNLLMDDQGIWRPHYQKYFSTVEQYNSNWLLVQLNKDPIVQESYEDKRKRNAEYVVRREAFFQQLRDNRHG